MATFTIHLTESDDGVTTSVSRDGERLRFDRASETRSHARVLAAVDETLLLVGADQNYGGDICQALVRDGHRLRLAGDPDLVRIAAVHLDTLWLAPRDQSREEREPNDPCDAEHRLAQVLEAWAKIVNDSREELRVARAHRSPAATGHGALPRVAIVPEPGAHSALGHMLEVIAGRALAPDTWAAPLHCAVRLQSGESADEVEIVDDRTRASLVEFLETLGNRYLDKEPQQLRLGQLEWLTKQAPSHSPRARLSLSHATTDAWEIRLRDPNAWFDGAEICGLFAIDSVLPGRSERGRALAADASLRLVLSRDGDRLQLLHNQAIVAEASAEALKLLADSYARLECSTTRDAPDGRALLRALYADCEGHDLHRDRGLRLERLFDDAVAGTIPLRNARRYLDHALGRDVLLKPLRTWAIAHASGASVRLGAVRIELLAAATRLEAADSTARDSAANAERAAAAAELRKIITRRGEHALEGLRSDLGAAKRALLGAKEDRSRAATAVRWTALDLRDDRESTVRPGGAAVVIERGLGARLRRPVEQAWRELEAQAAKLLARLRSGEPPTAAPERSPSKSALPTPLPLLGPHLRVRASASDHEMNAAILRARGEYAAELEAWLEVAADATIRTILIEALTHSERRVAAALAEVPGSATDKPACASPPPSAALRAMAAALRALATEIME